MFRPKTLFLLMAAVSCGFIVTAQTHRSTLDLSNKPWKIVLDPKASWANDKLFAPPASVSSVPVNVPTGGWSLLSSPGKMTTLPATVEQYYWGSNGNAFGSSGNYLGVSWFTTKVAVPAAWRGKRVRLLFESVRFRAEVFVNRKLAAYDLVNSTPFEVDVSSWLAYGAQNEIAVRITDPNGNFDWRDSQNFMWGDYRTIPTHGFGGITGKVKLVATDGVFISDIYVKNKPKTTEVDVEVTGDNRTGSAQTGDLAITVRENAPTRKIVYQQTRSSITLPAGESTQRLTVSVAGARLWSVEHPDLYTLTATWKGRNGSLDAAGQRFGFRWFEVRDTAGDRQFYLNGKRIVVRTAISWGFWPVNGIAPTDALARKQVEDAKRLGLNMLNFHRTIGQRNVLDYADELGLLYFEEPGGNQYPAGSYNATDALGILQRDFYFAVRSEKLSRMIKRDRSHPSLVIYNMHNERGADPLPEDKAEMLGAHALDESRILLYNSSNGAIKMGPDPHFKTHLMPYDMHFYDYGWFDQHHAGGPGVYHDNLYKSPTDYLRYTDHKDEIIYYGEEGAIGTPPRLQLIRDKILETGQTIGWETDAYLKWYDAYDTFLHKRDFTKAFPNVDSLTRNMGNVAYYYQGRAIENIRINNTVDGYAVNGWESMKQENHSGIVDDYRNLKGDPDLIAYYNRPAYVAVKLNRKVLAVGDTTMVDLHIVNEINLRGQYELDVKITDASGKTVPVRSSIVSVAGGNTYGELLLKGVPVVAHMPGYATITAELKRDGRTVLTGRDRLFAVKPDASGIGAVTVADTSGTLSSFLAATGVRTSPYRGGRPKGDYLLVGAFDPQQTGNPLVTDILEWVNEGHTLVVVSNSEKWADHLSKKEALSYRGSKELGTSWYGGNYFLKSSRLFAGLPQDCVFNWEYQCFAAYNRSRIGLRIDNGETIVGCVSDHKPEVYSALSVIPHGRGRIVLTSLDIFSCIKDVKAVTKAEGDGENAASATFNASGANKANVVGRQLLLNMLKF